MAVISEQLRTASPFAISLTASVPQVAEVTVKPNGEVTVNRVTVALVHQLAQSGVSAESIGHLIAPFLIP